MIQQINLYQEEFYVAANWANQLLYAGVAFLLLILVGGSVYQSSVISDLEAEMKKSSSELTSLEQSFEALDKAVQPRAIDMNLAEQVEKVKRVNMEKIRAKTFLSSDGAGNVTGFSSLLQGLGRQRDEIEELWLKNIQFSNGGFEMRLVGSNYRPGLLPEFIQALNDEDLYRNREFREIKITRSSKDSNVMDFVLATNGEVADSEEETDMTEKAMFMARLKRFSEQKANE